MKKMFMAAVFLMAAGAVAFGQSKTADYSGSWVLDKQQSKDLPPYYSSVVSHKIAVTQDGKQMNVTAEIQPSDGDPLKTSFPYNSDGSETKIRTPVRTPNGLIDVPATIRMEPKADGTLLITISRQITTGDRSFNAVSVEDWRLSPDGKTLTIRRTDETPRGKTVAEMVFIKQ